MESGTIVKWLKSEGERVEKGEPLYELDTDQVAQEVEADAAGVVLKIAVAEGDGGWAGAGGSAVPRRPRGRGDGAGGAEPRPVRGVDGGGAPRSPKPPRDL